MSCRGDKSVVVKDIPSQQSGTVMTVKDTAKNENLPSKSHGMISEGENKENISGTNAQKKQQRSSGLCRGDRNADVKTDALSQVSSTKNTSESGVISKGKEGEIMTVKDVKGPNAKDRQSSMCGGSKSVEVMDIKTKNTVGEQSVATQGNKTGICSGSKSVEVTDGSKSVELKDGIASKQSVTSSGVKTGACSGSKSVEVKDQSEVHNTSKQTAATSSKKAGACISSKSVEIKDQKTDELASKQTAATASKKAGAGSSSKSVEVKDQKTDELASKQMIATKANKTGICSGSKSAEVKDQASVDFASKQTVATKTKKAGACSGSKSVEVKDQAKIDIASKQNSATPANKAGSKSVEVKETKSENIANKQTAAMKNNRAALCSGSKSVQVKNPPTDVIERKQSVAFKEKNIKSIASKEMEETNKKKPIQIDKVKDENKMSIEGPSSSSAIAVHGQPISEKKVGKNSFGLCCSGSSVTVKDSVLPGNVSALNKSENKSDPMITEKENDQKEVEYLLEDDVSESEQQITESFQESQESIPSIPKNKKMKKKKKSYVDDEPEARRKSFALNSKKGKYAVSSEVEDEALYASIKPKVKGNKKMMNPQISDEKPETDLEERPAKKLRQDTPQKKRRKKALDTNEELRSVYESQMASLQTRTLSNGEYTLTSQPTVEEEGDLLENAEEERKKNKQRLREKKRTGHGSPNLDSTAKAYDSAQREIDKVLGPRLSHEDSEEKKNKEKTKKKKENKGKDNEGFVDDEKKEDTLEEARQRMHKLLDDAFSLISHSKSSISNKIQPVSSSDEPSSMISKPNTPREDRSVPANINSPATDEKKHTPLNVQRTHEPYDSSGLVTWSPYRASDEIAVISLPHTQTNLSTQPPQQEKLTTSTFNESAPPSRRTSYFATQPGEPIVIRTKDIDSSLPPSGNQKQKILNGDSLQHIANGSRKHHETFQNPVYENTLPLRTMDSYSEPYHGLASYQDLPVSHLTDNGRKISNGRPPVRQSAWQEERSKLGSLGLPLSASSSPRDTIDVRGHAAPQRGERKHYDEVDVIKESLRPGASPQPLINSLREELQMLSSKKHSGTTTSSTNGETVKMKSTEPGRRSFMQGDSESSWGSMHRNTSNV